MTQHTKISYLKSLIRIIGYAALFVNFPGAILILIASELVGIAEEWAL